MLPNGFVRRILRMKMIFVGASEIGLLMKETHFLLIKKRKLETSKTNFNEGFV